MVRSPCSILPSTHCWLAPFAFSLTAVFTFRSQDLLTHAANRAVAVLTHAANRADAVAVGRMRQPDPSVPLARACSSNARARWLKEDMAMAGFVLWTLRTGDSVIPTYHAFLLELQMDVKWRNAGLDTALAQDVQRETWDRCSGHMGLEVFDDNVDAQRLYRRLTVMRQGSPPITRGTR